LALFVSFQYSIGDAVPRLSRRHDVAEHFQYSIGDAKPSLANTLLTTGMTYFQYSIGDATNMAERVEVIRVGDFQYSIGDAVIMTMLEWVKEKEASFNTPLEMHNTASATEC